MPIAGTRFAVVVLGLAPAIETPMTEDAQPAQGPPVAAPPAKQGIVMRNAAILVVAQVVGMPLSVGVNAAMGRYLGAEDFGYLYLATTFASFAFLFVECGQQAALAGRVARQRERSPELLGSALVWRLGASVLAYAALAGSSHLMGHTGATFQIALALVALMTTIGTISSAVQDTIRGFERTDVSAWALVGRQFLTALFVVPTLVLGGSLGAALTAQSCAYLVVCVLVFGALRRMRIGSLAFDSAALKQLLTEGFPFLFMGLILVLQPYVDALFLSELGSPESMGWLAAARKLIGLLVFPASAITVSLFPTLSRLYSEDRDEYCQNAANALRTATILVVPASLGCALYADIGVSIFSEAAFGPAEDNLRILAVFVLLVYFSMVLGTVISAAGLQRKWAVTQLACVAVSVIADPLLIPWFQEHMNNGGLGVCVTSVFSEVLMVCVGIYLAPSGIFGKQLRRGLLLALVAGAAMAAVAVGLSRLGLNQFIAAPIAVLAYAASLWFTGVVDREELRAIRAMLARKAPRT